jgi:predicted nucleic acid-binding protein
MADLLLDSDVVIWHLRGRREVVELLVGLAGRARLGLSVLSRAEVLAGMRESERTATLRFLDACESLPVGSRIADRAGEMVRKARESGGTMHLPDALIASTALEAGIPLYTCNPRHYLVEGLEIRAVSPRA